MLRVSYTDAAGIIPDSVRTQYMERQRRVLDQVRGGMAEYADSLGWLDPDTWGGSTVQAELTELAAEVRGGADVFVLTGVGGSNNAARAVITALAPDSVPAGLAPRRFMSTLSLKTLKRLNRAARSAYCVRFFIKHTEAVRRRALSAPVRRKVSCTGCAWSTAGGFCRFRPISAAAIPPSLR